MCCSECLELSLRKEGAKIVVKGALPLSSVKSRIPWRRSFRSFLLAFAKDRLPQEELKAQLKAQAQMAREATVRHWVPL